MTRDSPAVQHHWRHVIRPAVGWAVIDTVVVFGVAGWLYGALIAVFNPDDLAGVIVSWLPVRRDSLAVVCFALSAAAYLVREVGERARRNSDA